jgi:hypothetical protein
VACFDGAVRCPSFVTPQYLHDATTQGVCASDRINYYCSARCSVDGSVNWLGETCENDQMTPCPPWGRTIVPLPTSE